MAIVVVGGHSRNVGKTSLVAGLIAALPEYEWTAAKITQYGHGICSADGSPCACACDDHTWAITEERVRSGESDTSRFLVAGAARSLWVRTRQGMLAEAMPKLCQELAKAKNVILESNSVLRFIQPDIYLTVVNPANADFKDSARQYLDLASAVVLHGNKHQIEWKEVSLKTLANRPTFFVSPPNYCTPEIVDFVRNRLGVTAVAR
jgi:molybdopterin-guanine dinucleotide biosynthesis protein